jgi:replicative DNA helicase
MKEQTRSKEEAAIIEFLRNSPAVPNEKLLARALTEECQFLKLILSDKDLLTNSVESGIIYSCFQNDVTKKLYQLAAEHFDLYQVVLSRPALDQKLANCFTPEEGNILKSKYDTIFGQFAIEAGLYEPLKNGIESRYMQRQGLAVVRKFLDPFMNATTEQKRIISDFQNCVSAISAFGDAENFEDIKDMSQALEGVDSELQERREHPENFIGIKCLYPKMDFDYNGFRKRKYMVIQAHEGGGKTTLMLNFARNFALSGNSVVYVTMESGIQDIAMRMLTIDSQVSYNRIMRGGKDPEFGLPPSIMSDLNNSRLSLTNKIGGKFNLIQVLEQTPLSKIFRLIQRVRSYTAVDVVFLDYLQVVGRDVRHEGRVDQDIADVSMKFRSWGRSRNVLAITANQIKSDKGRKLQEKVVNEEDIRITKADGSGTKEIAGSADYMFGCWIPESKDRMVVWSTKTRAGKDGQKYTLLYDPESGRLDPMDDFGDTDDLANAARDKENRERARMKVPERNITGESDDLMSNEIVAEVPKIPIKPQFECPQETPFTEEDNEEDNTQEENDNFIQTEE